MIWRKRAQRCFLCCHRLDSVDHASWCAHLWTEYAAGRGKSNRSRGKGNPRPRARGLRRPGDTFDPEAPFWVDGHLDQPPPLPLARLPTPFHHRHRLIQTYRSPLPVYIVTIQTRPPMYAACSVTICRWSPCFSHYMCNQTVRTLDNQAAAFHQSPYHARSPRPPLPPHQSPPNYNPTALPSH